MSWERCGNTPYYRRQVGPGWFYVNPFNWSQISISVETNDNWAGAAWLLYRKAPGYDWDMLKQGVHTVASTKPEQLKYLKSTHGWAVDLIRAKELKIGIKDLRKIFEGAPADERDQVLEGVGALLGGYQAAALMEAGLAPDDPEADREADRADKDITLIAIGRDTPAFQRLAQIEETFDFAKRFIVEDSLEKAIEEALAYFGIYEC